MPTSQFTEGTSSEMVAEQRPVMPVDIYTAAIIGDTDVLIQRLGLSKEESNPFETKYDNVRAELRSTTCSGDTILHLVITKDRNNEIAQKIFRKEVALLKTLNKKSETSLHVAARVGNYEVIKNLIEIDSGVVKDALREVDNNGDTALHIAAKYGHDQFFSHKLMNLDPQVVYQVNREGLSSLYLSILEGNTGTVEAMLRADPNLACTQFYDDTFPVHAAARMGNADLVIHLFNNYTNSVELLDRQGRNLFHHAASENKNKIFIKISNLIYAHELLSSLSKNVVVDVGNEMQEQAMENHILSSTPNESGWHGDRIVVRMINEKDYQGNTPLHVASMKGARKTAKTIWKRWLANEVAETNNKGLTAFELSMLYELENNKKEDIKGHITNYVKYHGRAFNEDWFGVVKPSLMKWMDIFQILGLASVLMATVTFAAAFTIPGGYNADGGTPLLGRRYMFKTFILANTLAFIQSFACIFSLVFNIIVFQAKAVNPNYTPFLFLSASCCTVVAFGSGSYVMLAPINKNIAIIIFVLALLFGTPTMFMIDMSLGKFFRWLGYRKSKHGRMLLFVVISLYALPLLFIFCLAFLT